MNEFKSMNVYDLLDEVSNKAQEIINEMQEVDASQLGLDQRCGTLFIDHEFLAVTKGNDRDLQYYGGFEYVDKSNRIELGTYVFYSAESNRVLECIQIFFEEEILEDD